MPFTGGETTALGDIIVAVYPMVIPVLAAPIGTIEILEPASLSDITTSTHTFSLPVIIEVIRRDIQLDVFIIAIQPGHILWAKPPSEAVTQAVNNICNLLDNLI